MDAIELKKEIIRSAETAVKELIKVAKESIIKEDYDELSPDIAADRLKNAAASKKLAIFDAFEILSRIELEKSMLESGDDDSNNMNSFAERRAK